MESSTGVLKDLAAREQVLTGKVAAARDEAARIISEAEAKAKALLSQAEAEALKMTSEYRDRLKAEEQGILETTRTSAKTAADGLRAAAESKVGEAVKLIVSKVLP